jgi:inorganic triphosphatase YgiF
MALRLRRAGRRWVQGLKAGTSGTGGLHARQEWEFEQRDPRIDLALFAQTPLAQVDDAATLHERLACAFVVDVMRTTWKLSPAPGASIEIALDEGTVASDARREAITEVEIECLEGDATLAFDLAARLLDGVAMRPTAVTKAQRGYRLFRGTRIAPLKAGPIALDRAMSPAAAARAIVSANLAQLQANEEGVMHAADASEFVHQARIALRRLRSALRLFRESIGAQRASAWRGRLSETGAALGRARDWDVLVSDLLPPMLRTFGDEALLRRVRAGAAKRRRAEREHARQSLRAAPHAKVVLEIARWLSEAQEPVEAAESVAAFAARVARRRHKRLVADALGIAGMTAAERHRVRIDAKRLRYGIEGLASLFKAGRTKRYVERLVALQDALGRSNDGATALSLLPQLDLPAALESFARGWFGAIARGDPGALEALVAGLERAKRPWKGLGAGKSAPA